jgi:hypothetical protein
MMTLTHADVRDLLIGFAAAIELDQIRVDALPTQRFHPIYDDGMWRRYRRDHLNFIDRLLPTVTTISTAALRKLTRLAVAYDPFKKWKCPIVASSSFNRRCPLAISAPSKF